jgi:hypothetical protein
MTRTKIFFKKERKACLELKLLKMLTIFFLLCISFVYVQAFEFKFNTISKESISSPKFTSVTDVPSTSSDPSPPLFGPIMTAPFNQTITYMGFQWKNHVDFYYDSTTQPVGSSLSAHSQGQNDEVCTDVKAKAHSEEPCSLIDHIDGWLYVYYPQSSFCCRACNTTDYCGIISSTWLQNDAIYQGTQTFSGIQADGWMKQGGEQNYYFTTVASRNDKNRRVPVVYYEGYPTFSTGNNTWVFDINAYSNDPIPLSTFNIPQNMGCESMCELTGKTFEERLWNRLGKVKNLYRL